MSDSRRKRFLLAAAGAPLPWGNGMTDSRRKRFLLASAALAFASLQFAELGTAISDGEPDGELVTLPPPPRRVDPDETPTLAFPDAPILLQAYVEPIGHTEHGSIIQLVGPAWNAIIRALADDPAALFRLTPEQMEQLVAASYDAAGFDEVILTPRSGDLGRDVIAIKRGWFSVRIIDQVKAFAPGHRVTANDVRALSGVLHGDRQATKGIVTTTSTFAPGIETDPYIAPFFPYRLELIDGQALTSRLLELSPSRNGGG